MTPGEMTDLLRKNGVSHFDGMCGVCSRALDDGARQVSALEPALAELVRANSPGRESLQSACTRCVNLFERAERQIREESATRSDGSHVLSTPLRLDADERFTGAGVTIAFLDSGFFPHADLTRPRNRIVAYKSLLDGDGDVTSLFEPDAASWHGMMTSVVAAGNGSLSNGFYRGIAPDSDVVLVKLARTGRITEDNIRAGLEWVLENRERFGIKVVNISAGGDFEQSYLTDPLSQTVERCVAEGLVVVCAVGNAGHLPNHPIFPPASAPSCIAVGGLDDNNSLYRAGHGMYRSSFGPTVDGFQKPELIAPSIWVPAPILPDTPTAKQAELLERLDRTPDEELQPLIAANPGIDGELDAASDRPAYIIRQVISLKLHKENVINKHYKYVDGTSFAAPIVSSVAAQMIEANPAMTPQQVKHALITTAERLPHIEVDRQGWGVVDPRRAVERAVGLRGEN